MPEPQTEAGKALLNFYLSGWWDRSITEVHDAIAAIEAEARDAALAEAEAAVESALTAHPLERLRAVRAIHALRSGGAG